jgi:hypothetical protein
MENAPKDRWMSLDYGLLRIGTDEERHGAEELTVATAKLFVAGALDYCDGCMRLVAPFTGPHCDGCEQYCREHYGTCGFPGCTELATQVRFEPPLQPADEEAEIARLRALGKCRCVAHPEKTGAESGAE